MDLPNSKTFCVAPWFQIRNSNDGSKKVCCGISSSSPKSVDQDPLEFLNSEEVMNLKENLHHGKRVKECSGCWKPEAEGRISLRQQLNGILTNNSSSIENTWLDSYFRQKQDFTSDDLLMADIKIGNTCNYACVMCVPSDSSMIYNEWIKKPNAFFIKNKLRNDPGYLERIRFTGYRNKIYRNYVEKILSNRNLKFLKLLGGEPLLDQKLITDLRNLPENRKKKIHLHIVTNASKDLSQTREYLGNFKFITFTVSLEGTAGVQEYARYGSNWSEVSANILKFKEKFPTDIIVHTVLQTTSILGFEDLARWTNKNNLALQMGICINPDYLSFSSLPDAVREKVKKSLSKAKIIISQTRIGDEEGWPVDKIIDIMESTKFDIEQYKKFMNYIKWYENGKKLPNLRDIFPALFIDKF